MNFFIQSVRSPILTSQSVISQCCLRLFQPTYFHTGSPRFAEPMKKKKKIDPALIKAREERRRKRLEKSIKKLEKCTKQLKPLEELELPLSLKNEVMLRKRILQPEIEHKFSQILKPWADYCNKKVCHEELMFQRLLSSKETAMKELMSISGDLYTKCLKVDESLLPYSTSGPKNTAALKTYSYPDGEWIEESKLWK